MKNLTVSFLLFSLMLFGTEKFEYAKVKISGPEDLKFMITNNIDIDRTSFSGKGFPEYVTVFVDQEKYDLIQKEGYVITWEPLKLPKDASSYRYNEDIGDSMLIWQNRYPDICKRLQIGTSVQGRPLWVLKITDNVDIEEAEPEMKFVSTMHGDEVTGVEMEMYMIEDILNGYQANNDTMRFIVDNTELYVMPLMNPDGMAYGPGGRYNANGVDLNRNFPEGLYNEPNDPSLEEPEIAALINWSNDHNFILSTNYHGGALVVNYGYDIDEGVPNYSYAPAPDDEHLTWLAYNYSVRNTPMFNSTSFTNGITNGSEWYQVTGGMQDWNYRYYNDIDMTLEISSTKWPDYSYIPGFWADNRDAMFWYLSALHKGIYGIVTDSSSGLPLNATIEIAGIDKQYYTDPDFGDYYRILKAGTYSMTVSAPGYYSQTINDIVVNDNTGKFREATEVNVALVRTSQPDIVLSISDTLNISSPPGFLGSTNLEIGNSGNLDLNYNMTISYDGLSDITVEDNNFESGIGYANSGVLIWNTAAGGTWNSYSACASLAASGGGNASSNQTGVLTSDVFDGSVCSTLTLEFDQSAVLSNSSVTIEVYDGAWNTVYSSTSSVSGRQKITLNSAFQDMQIRFTGNMRNRSGDSWSIDNIIVHGTELSSYAWLSFNSSNQTEGIVNPSESVLVSVDYDTAGLAYGSYYASITIISDDPQEGSIVLPVKLTVTDQLSAPSNVIVVSATSSQIDLVWDAVSGATLYHIYRSTEPYIGFAEIGTSGTETYTDTEVLSGSKYFYYITSDNAKR